MSSNIRIQKTCEYCGNTFTAQTTVTRYCSKKCNNRHYKERKREEKIREAKQKEAERKEQSNGEVPSKDKEFLSIGEASELLGVSKRTFYRLMKDGKVNYKKLRGRTIIKKEHIEILFD